MLIFVAGRPDPVYVPWVDVERVDLDRPLDGASTREQAPPSGLE